VPRGRRENLDTTCGYNVLGPAPPKTWEGQKNFQKNSTRYRTTSDFNCNYWTISIKDYTSGKRRYQLQSLLRSTKKLTNLCPLSKKFSSLILTHPRSPLRVLCRHRRLRSGHETLLEAEFQTQNSAQSDLRHRVPSRWVLSQISSCDLFLFIHFTRRRCLKFVLLRGIKLQKKDGRVSWVIWDTSVTVECEGIFYDGFAI